jgi:pyridoxal phosphate enzyme (YggS family)
MDTTEAIIRSNFENIQERIIKAASSCGRDASQIKLIVVSKTHTIEVIRTAYQAGARYFGENYPEESVSKIISLENTPGIEWHMIGHLQSRKARLVAEHFQMIQSLDSIHLAEKLERILDEIHKTMPVLLEFNVSGEESKYGWPAWRQDHWEVLFQDVSNILKFPHLQVTGLMTMPPLLENPDEVRPYFKKLNSLKTYLSQYFQNNEWKELSMGTSADFEIAIQEGATIIRIGQAILGSRPEKSQSNFHSHEGV